MYCVPSEVLQHRPAGEELLCTQGAFGGLGVSSCRGEIHRFADGAGAKGRLASGKVCGARVRLGADASGACAAAGESLRSVRRQPLQPVCRADLTVGLAPPPGPPWPSWGHLGCVSMCRQAAIG